MLFELSENTLWIIRGIAALITLLLYVELDRKQAFSDYSMYMAVLINSYMPPVVAYIICYWIFVRTGMEAPHKNISFWLLITVLVSILGYVLMPQYYLLGMLYV